MAVIAHLVSLSVSQLLESKLAHRRGGDTTLYGADYVLKAVFFPPGNPEVEFYYDPLSFRIGAAISLGTLICVTLIGFWLALRRRPHT